MARLWLRLFNQKGRGCFVSSISKHTHRICLKRINEIVFDDSKNNIMHGDLQFGVNDFIAFTFSARSTMWCTHWTVCASTQRRKSRWYLVSEWTCIGGPDQHSGFDLDKHRTTTTDNVNRRKLPFFSLYIISEFYHWLESQNPHPYLQTSVQAVTKQQLLLVSPRWGPIRIDEKLLLHFPFSHHLLIHTLHEGKSICLSTSGAHKDTRTQLDGKCL